VGRYFCKKKQMYLPKLKVNEYCLLKARCPELMVKTYCKRVRRVFTRQAIPNTLTDLVNCEG